MTGRIRIGIAAVAAASALLLSACGGGDDGAEDEIEGVEENTDAGGEESAEPSPSASEDDGIDRPEIELPDDVNNVFEEVDTDDPVELAVLADHERRIESLDEALTSGDMNRPALGFYSTGQALESAVDWIEPAVTNGYSWKGTVRYYDREVSVSNATEATVNYCVDETDIEGIYRETGEPRDEGGDEDATGHLFYNTRLEKNDQGVWQTTMVDSRTLEGPC
ncbi:hypothetical protein [Streptomyces sp. B6B3]|uniref:hypothetical protein n=1 Tax=Streptomyces sp. B6B3 TaxID=3153570 RepID=UPI00325F30FA